MIKFYCSHCGTKISAELSDAGASANCPSCGQDLIVPTALGDATVESQDRAVEISDQSSDVYTLGETRGGNEMSREDAEHSLGHRLKTGAKDGWSSIKSQSKQAALRTQIEKLKNVDLRIAHHSLGEKCFESGIFDVQLGEQFQAIRNLDATIADKRTDEEVEDDETKRAALKRMGIHALKASQAQVLLLKRQRLLEQLGQSAFLLCASEVVNGIGPARETIEGIGAQIRNKETEILASQRANKGKGRAPMLAVATVVILAVATGAFVVMKVSSGGAEKPATVHSYQPIQSQKIANSSADDDLLEAGFTQKQINSLKNTAAATGNSWNEVKRLLLKHAYPEEFREVEREQRLQKVREIERERSR